MGFIGWITTAHDLRDEHLVLSRMAAELTDAPLRVPTVRAARHAGFAHRGTAGSYGDWRHPERPDPDLALIIDGHLTNRRRVEEQLYQRPRPLSSDAEVLLHAYRRWGAAVVDRIDGSAANAIWDNQARQLLLIRDPLGAKALYYTLVPDGIVFSTRATALLAHPHVEPVIDTDGLNELLTLGPIRTPGHAVLRDIHEVLPGEMIRYTPAGLRRHRYWQLQADEHGQNVDTTGQYLRQALTEHTAALRVQPTGAVLLSGGFASAAAAALTNSPNGHRRAAWTLALTHPAGPPTDTYPDDAPGRADIDAADQVARHLKLRHLVAAVGGAALIDDAATACTALDFPGHANADAPLFSLLRRIAAAGTASIVTGDGASAVFGGHPWLHDPESLAVDDFPWQQGGLAPTDLLNTEARMQLIPGGYRKQRYDDAANASPQLAGEDMLAARHRRMAWLTLTHHLPYQLTRLDQLAGAAGLTAHTPLADWLLAQYTLNLPFTTKHLLGIPAGLLRHILADSLPPEIAWLPQKPAYMAHAHALWQQAQRHHLHGLITDPNAPLHAVLDKRRVVDVLTQAPTRPTHDWHTTIAYLIEVNAWLTRHRICEALEDVPTAQGTRPQNRQELAGCAPGGTNASSSAPGGGCSATPRITTGAALTRPTRILADQTVRSAKWRPALAGRRVFRPQHRLTGLACPRSESPRDGFGWDVPVRP